VARPTILESGRQRYRTLLARLYRPPLAPPLALLYRGSRVECPCCGGTFRKFIPTVPPVGRIRPNARCPACGARDRNRHLWLYLANKTSLLSDRLRVLHFAPERILERKLKEQPNLDYVTTDLDRPRAMVKADITDLPFPDASFDLILCSHVLEHVVEDRRAMRELYRVLRAEGWAIVLVPIDFGRAETLEDPTVVAPAERERLFGQADHVRIYGRDFKQRLEEAGFSVRVEDYRRELGDDSARRYGLRPRTPDIHLCSKPFQPAEKRAASSEPRVASPSLYEWAPAPASRPPSAIRYSSRIGRPSNQHSRISRTPAA
jgi:SAM-dependent methyltransferase